MSNDMKMIMEGWRRTLKENNKQEELDEGMMSKVFAGLLVIAGKGGLGPMQEKDEKSI